MEKDKIRYSIPAVEQVHSVEVQRQYGVVHLHEREASDLRAEPQPEQRVVDLDARCEQQRP